MSQYFSPGGRPPNVAGPASMPGAGCQPSLGTHRSPIVVGATRASLCPPPRPAPASAFGAPPEPLAAASKVVDPPEPPDVKPESMRGGAPPPAELPTDDVVPPHDAMMSAAAARRTMRDPRTPGSGVGRTSNMRLNGTGAERRFRARLASTLAGITAAREDPGAHAAHPVASVTKVARTLACGARSPTLETFVGTGATDVRRATIGPSRAIVTRTERRRYMHPAPPTRFAGVGPATRARGLRQAGE